MDDEDSDELQPIPDVPGGLLHLPPDSVRIVDADEEIFILYTLRGGLERWEGLGSIDSRRDEITVKLEIDEPSLPVTTAEHICTPAVEGLPTSPLDSQPDESTSTPSPSPSKFRSKSIRAKRRSITKPTPKTITVEVQLLQNTTSLRSRKGDTGSVLWRASVHLARLLLTQHHFPPPPPQTPLLAPTRLSTSHILELGAGTGLLGVLLSPLVARYTITDIAPITPLIKKNLSLNGLHTSSTVSVEELDWVQIHTTPPASRARLFPSLSGRASEPPVDLVLCVDCLYNPALVGPLVSTIAHVAGAALVLVVSELRDEDVLRAFLERWVGVEGWEVWRVGGNLLDPHFVAWVGWKNKS
ncbi:hypothetical protein BOTBODRAFT_28495 [Botryobasidium botryosum FD-172 SS1]|uniref:Uncharacterized protein n=1 Tax=Botryobasidium botryosum (strain FD-172 SS1) TaxID=930990 RepID=A0A067N5G3_BOTB1|nr:hypothetical protein BOTBODRAFT_28495 [Botryobasidium botryosum FD-172 SS1]